MDTWPTTRSPNGPLTGLLDGLFDRLGRLRRRVLRRRRWWAAVLLGLAVLSGLAAVRPAPAPTVRQVVASRDLPAGRTLVAGDLAVVQVPAGARPAGLLDDPVGRLLAGPMRRGEAITDARVISSTMSRALPGGRRALPVRLSDTGQAGLLRVGDRIDLLSAHAEHASARTVSLDAHVLALPAAADSTDPGLPGRLVVLAVSAADVAGLAAAAATAYVTYTWRPR